MPLDDLTISSHLNFLEMWIEIGGQSLFGDRRSVTNLMPKGSGNGPSHVLTMKCYIVCILIGGIIGVCSASNPTNTCLITRNQETKNAVFADIPRPPVEKETRKCQSAKMRLYAILLLIGIAICITAAKETVTNEVEEPSSTVEDKDALQTKEEDADEPEEDNPDEKDETEAAEDPSGVESAEGEENDGEENDVELEDGGAAAKKVADPLWRRRRRRRRRLCYYARRRYVARRRYIARRRCNRFYFRRRRIWRRRRFWRRRRG
eukprot:Seg1492.3 transcript_id=Seg1492.3/GoldUCD/mRNA.D3Y31 product="hypothetical protein" protein_id=Seg1492.3/GoldUCD/D3Y31